MSFLLLKIAASRYDGLVSTRQGRHDGSMMVDAQVKFGVQDGSRV